MSWSTVFLVLGVLTAIIMVILIMLGNFYSIGLFIPMAIFITVSNNLMFSEHRKNEEAIK